MTSVRAVLCPCGLEPRVRTLKVDDCMWEHFVQCECGEVGPSIERAYQDAHHEAFAEWNEFIVKKWAKLLRPSSGGPR